MSGDYNERNVFDGADANGLYPAEPVSMWGKKALAFYGAFDGATVTARFYTEDRSGTLQPLGDDTDLTFTSIEAPAVVSFPREMPVQFEITNAGASTSIGLNAHQVVD